MLSLEVNGEVFNDALSIRVSRSLSNFMGHFQARSSSNTENLLPVKMGDAIKVLADGLDIFNGYVEVLDVSQSSDQHTITISGRDRTADVLDSTVAGEILPITGPITFVQLIEDILAAGNINDILVIDEVNDIIDFAADDTVDTEVGTKIFNFLEPYARKQQFLITTNEDGDILLMRASTEPLGFNLLRAQSDPQNNILSSELSLNNENRYNKYITRSQLNPYNAEAEILPENISSQLGEADPDSEIRTSRILTLNMEEDGDDDVSFNRAKFEQNIRAAQSLNYSCTIQGHSFNGAPIKINRIASIRDDLCGMSGEFLLQAISYVYSVRNGSTTDLSFTHKNAFTLQAEQTARDAARTDSGDGFV